MAVQSGSQSIEGHCGYLLIEYSGVLVCCRIISTTGIEWVWAINELLGVNRSVARFSSLQRRPFLARLSVCRNLAAF